MHPSSRVYRAARSALTTLICACAVFAAGCHNNNIDSGYGIAWVTLTDTPGDFTSYIVNIDSITLTRSDGAVVTALATEESVDFTKLSNIAELWGTATIPLGTYVLATIELDYTGAQISLMVNGKPQLATVVDDAGEPVTTQTINVILDTAHPLVIPATYATTAAQRLALDFNLAASTVYVNPSASPPVVSVRPYFTAAIAPPDNKLVRVRGPLINSSVDLLTYTVYVRPFFDEINSLGSLSIFTNADTVFATNGVVTTGSKGLDQLSQSSAGTTVTAAYTTYQPTPTPTATAGIYTAKYVIAGSTLEDIYTQGIEGDVIARSGNTVTLRGATLQIDNGSSISNTIYNVADATVLLGPSTIVTADDETSLTGLTYQSVGVGQHIIARGICNTSSSTGCSGVIPPVGAISFDATGNTATNTGSVRLISTNLWGSLVSSTAGNLLLNVEAINNWPIADFNFAGNGSTAASDPTGASFLVNSGAIALPDTAVGDSLFINGIVAPFGSAPPDFNATSVNSELSVQEVGAAVPGNAATCGQGQPACIPASMRVYYHAPGAKTPFLGLDTGGAVSVNITNGLVLQALIRIGSESIDMATLPASPTIIGAVAPASVTATATATGSLPQVLPPVFLPEFSYGDPTLVGTTTAPEGVTMTSSFGSFASGLTTALATTPALVVEARGTYDRATNTFYAISINVVL